MAGMAAVCVFLGALHGYVIELHQHGDTVTVSHNISFANPALAKSGDYHGFHIHEKGELGNQCKDAGGHYNPDKVNHGYPFAEVHHRGDLGNLSAEPMTLPVDKFFELKDVIGRAFVVHADRDDGGLGGADDSLTTGHAGARVDCCKIVATSTTGAAISGMQQAQVWITTAMIATTIFAARTIAS